MLLTAVGQNQTLSAIGFDNTGATVAAAGVSWTSSRPDVATVAPDGTVDAASLGAAQITATTGDVVSPPIMVLVSNPAAGVTLVPDDQITSDPVDTDPNAPLSADNTYQVDLINITPAVGDLLLGTGGRALAGRVVAVSPGASGGAVTVTMALVPLTDLLPDLEINEVIDLTHAPVSVPDEVARLFDVSRNGDTFNFTGKADFEQLISATPSNAQLAAYHPGSTGLPDQPATGAQGTIAVPPFSSCETSLTAAPFKLTKAPSFQVALNPSIDLIWTKASGLERLVVHAAPTATMSATLAATIAFEGKITCEIELLDIRIPIGGPLSFFVGGILPVGVGAELGGKVTVATMSIGATVEAGAKASAGFDCPAGGSCTFARSIDNPTVTATPIVDAPSLADLRLQPSLAIFAFVKASIGNPFLRRLRFDAFEAKLGGKIAGDWAPQTVQILDPAYASNFKLTLEGSAGLGLDVDKLVKLLGLGSIASAELSFSTDLAGSPTGTLTTDKATYHAGDQATATVTVDPANLTFLGLYDVHAVELVRYSGGSLSVLGTSNAVDGQSTFTFNFTASDDVAASELYAFLVSNLPPLDLFSLELASSPPLTYTFDADLDTWEAGVAGPKSSKNWGTVYQLDRNGGIVQLDGTGRPGAPNAWIHKTITLPADTGTLSFDVSAHDTAVSDSHFTVRVVDGGTSTTLVDEVVKGQESGLSFKTQSVDISAWAGKTVTFFFEQDDNGLPGKHGATFPGGDEQVLLDNISILRR